MKSFVLVFLFAVLGAPILAGEPDLTPPEIVKKKGASVTAVAIFTTYSHEFTACAVVFKKTKDATFLITSSTSVIQAARDLNAPQYTVHVAFNPGTAAEHIVDASVMCVSDKLQLAVLKIAADTAITPLPMLLATAPPLKPGDLLWTIHAPYVDEKTPGLKAPELNITGDIVTHFNVANNLNEDTSMLLKHGCPQGAPGAPLLDAKGNLAAIWNGRGTAVAPPSILSLFDGEIATVQLRCSEHGKGGMVQGMSAKFNMIVDVVDPESRVTSLRACYLLGAVARPERTADGNWNLASPQMKSVSLQKDKLRGVAEITLTRTMKEAFNESCDIQIEYTSGGKTRRTNVFSASAFFQIDDFSDETLARAREASAASTSGKETKIVKEKPAAVAPQKDDDWLGGARDKEKHKAAAESLPLTVTAALGGKTDKLEGLSVCEINCDLGALTGMVFSDNGDYFYLLEGRRLRKVASASLIAERELTIQQDSTQLVKFKDGLLIVTRCPGDLWQIDPGTLEVKRRESLGNIAHLTAAPESTTAFAVIVETPGFETFGQSAFESLDLTAMKRVRRWTSPELWVSAARAVQKPASNVERLEMFNELTLSPDGHTLLCISQCALHRFSIKNGEVAYQEISPKFLYDQTGKHYTICFSPDSKWVGVPDGYGNTWVDGFPRLEGQGTYLFQADNIRAPTAGVVGEEMRALAFDSVAGKVYAARKGRQLLVCSMDGSVNKAFTLTTANDRAESIVVHPRGRKMLLRTDTKLFWVELPE